MNDEVRNTIHNIIKGAEGQLWQYPDLLQYFQQNYLLIDVNIDVQKPSFRRSILSFIEGSTGGNDAA
jgi:hypothetical protein